MPSNTEFYNHLATIADNLSRRDIEEALDYQFILSSDGSYAGVRLWVELGGPTTYIDTAENEIRTHHMNAEAAIPLNDVAKDVIDDYYTVLWDCIK